MAVYFRLRDALRQRPDRDFLGEHDIVVAMVLQPEILRADAVHFSGRRKKKNRALVL
jgi:hypothetical protein